MAIQAILKIFYIWTIIILYIIVLNIMPISIISLIQSILILIITYKLLFLKINNNITIDENKHKSSTNISNINKLKKHLYYLSRIQITFNCLLCFLIYFYYFIVHFNLIYSLNNNSNSNATDNSHNIIKDKNYIFLFKNKFINILLTLIGFSVPVDLSLTLFIYFYLLILFSMIIILDFNDFTNNFDANQDDILESNSKNNSMYNNNVNISFISNGQDINASQLYKIDLTNYSNKYKDNLDKIYNKITEKEEKNKKKIFDSIINSYVVKFYNKYIIMILLIFIISLLIYTYNVLFLAGFVVIILLIIKYLLNFYSQYKLFSDSKSINNYFINFIINNIGVLNTQEEYNIINNNIRDTSINNFNKSSLFYYLLISYSYEKYCNSYYIMTFKKKTLCFAAYFCFISLIIIYIVKLFKSNFYMFLDYKTNLIDYTNFNNLSSSKFNKSILIIYKIFVIFLLNDTEISYNNKYEIIFYVIICVICVNVITDESYNKLFDLDILFPSKQKILIEFYSENKLSFNKNIDKQNVSIELQLISNKDIEIEENTADNKLKVNNKNKALKSKDMCYKLNVKKAKYNMDVIITHLFKQENNFKNYFYKISKKSELPSTPSSNNSNKNNTLDNILCKDYIKYILSLNKIFNNNNKFDIESSKILNKFSDLEAKPSDKTSFDKIVLKFSLELQIWFKLLFEEFIISLLLISSILKFNIFSFIIIINISVYVFFKKKLKGIILLSVVNIIICIIEVFLIITEHYIISLIELLLYINKINSLLLKIKINYNIEIEILKEIIDNSIMKFLWKNLYKEVIIYDVVIILLTFVYLNKFKYRIYEEYSVNLNKLLNLCNNFYSYYINEFPNSNIHSYIKYKRNIENSYNIKLQSPSKLNTEFVESNITTYIQLSAKDISKLPTKFVENKYSFNDDYLNACKLEDYSQKYNIYLIKKYLKFKKSFYISMQNLIISIMLLFATLNDGIISLFYIVFLFIYLYKLHNFLEGRLWTFQKYIKYYLKPLFLIDVFLYFIFIIPYINKNYSRYNEIIGIPALRNYELYSYNLKSINIQALILWIIKICSYFLISIQTTACNTPDFKYFIIKYILKSNESKMFKSRVNTYLFNNLRIKEMEEVSDMAKNIDLNFIKLKQIFKNWNNCLLNNQNIALNQLLNKNKMSFKQDINKESINYNYNSNENNYNLISINKMVRKKLFKVNTITSRNIPEANKNNIKRNSNFNRKNLSLIIVNNLNNLSKQNSIDFNKHKNKNLDLVNNTANLNLNKKKSKYSSLFKPNNIINNYTNKSLNDINNDNYSDKYNVDKDNDLLKIKNIILSHYLIMLSMYLSNKVSLKLQSKENFIKILKGDIYTTTKLDEEINSYLNIRKKEIIKGINKIVKKESYAPNKYKYSINKNNFAYKTIISNSKNQIDNSNININEDSSILLDKSLKPTNDCKLLEFSEYSYVYSEAKNYIMSDFFKNYYKLSKIYKSILFNTFYLIFYFSEYVVYLSIFIIQFINADMFSSILPVIIVLFGIVQYPRPRKLYWKILILYSIFTIFIKFFVQMNVIRNLIIEKGKNYLIKINLI